MYPTARRPKCVVYHGTQVPEHPSCNVILVGTPCEERARVMTPKARSRHAGAHQSPRCKREQHNEVPLPLLSKHLALAVAAQDAEGVLTGKHRVGSSSSLPDATMAWETCKKSRYAPGLMMMADGASNTRRPSKETSTNCSLAIGDGAPDAAFQLPSAATPSAPHRCYKENDEFRVEDFVHLKPQRRGARPLTARQRSALFAQFALPVSNFEVLPRLLPIEWQVESSEWQAESSPTPREDVRALDRPIALEEFIPPC